MGMGYQTTDMAVCRLCSGTNHIFDVFHSLLDNGQQIRYSILLATGIHIKPTDAVSKMVCRRCCDVSIKLHQYRENAVANDKLLKERCGQPYSPPITDFDEVSRISTKLNKERKIDETIIILDDDSDDVLEIPNSPVPPITNSLPDDTSIHHSDVPSNKVAQLNSPVLSNTISQLDETSVQSRLDKLIDNLLLDVTENNPLPEEQFSIKGGEESATPQNDMLINDKSTIGITDRHQSVINKPFRDNKNCVHKIRYQHPSVQKIYKTFEGIVLPIAVFKSDVSPVISLNREEVNAWFDKHLKQKLPSVVIKKVPNSSNYRISSSPLTSLEAIASNTQDDKINKYILKPNSRRIICTNESDSDVANTERISNGTNQKENNVPSKETISTSPRITTPLKIANMHKTISAKKNNGRRPRTKRKRTPLDDSDTLEIIPEKKKRVYGNKNALKTFNKMDLPEVSPSDRNEQKAIFTSSLELKPVGQISSPTHPSIELTIPNSDEPEQQHNKALLRPVCIEVYDTEKKLNDHEKTHFKCSSCDKILANLESLKEHQIKNCSPCIINNKPTIDPKTIEDKESIVQKRVQGFEEPNNNTPTETENTLYCNEYIDYSRVEEILIPNSSDGLHNVVEAKDQNLGFTTQCEQNNQTKSIGHKIMQKPDFDSITKVQEESSGKTSDQIKLNKPFSTLSETEMIRHLLKKYSYSSSTISNDSITHVHATTGSLAKVNHMLTDLHTSIVPVEMNYQPTFNVTIKERVSVEEPHPVECWADKKIVYTQQPWTLATPEPCGLNLHKVQQETISKLKTSGMYQSSTSTASDDVATITTSPTIANDSTVATVGKVVVRHDYSLINRATDLLLALANAQMPVVPPGNPTIANVGTKTNITTNCTTVNNVKAVSSTMPITYPGYHPYQQQKSNSGQINPSANSQQMSAAYSNSLSVTIPGVPFRTLNPSVARAGFRNWVTHKQNFTKVLPPIVPHRALTATRANFANTINYATPSTTTSNSYGVRRSTPTPILNYSNTQNNRPNVANWTNASAVSYPLASVGNQIINTTQIPNNTSIPMTYNNARVLPRQISNNGTVNRPSGGIADVNAPDKPVVRARTIDEML